MIIMCGWHKKRVGKDLIIGEKEPFEDESRTDSICKDCLLYFFPDIYQKLHGDKVVRAK